MDKDIVLKKSKKWFGFGKESVVHKDFNMNTTEKYDLLYVVLLKHELGLMKFK